VNSSFVLRLKNLSLPARNREVLRGSSKTQDFLAGNSGFWLECQPKDILDKIIRRKKKGDFSMAQNVTAPMVGKIVDIKVKVGDRVQEDDEVAVLEAMKMEMPIVAPISGVVKEIRVSVGQTCETDMVMMIIE
jgi:acetyl-CoA carboxylase biotin carboxyl carrier protein